MEEGANARAGGLMQAPGIQPFEFLFWRIACRP
jgi:hypothetical protein